MAREYVRTDRNGTRIYHDYACPRCGGRGYYAIGVRNGQPLLSPLDGGVCWECGGRGQTDKPRVIKEYTPEYRAKLDAQAAKRQDKKIAERRAEHPAAKIAMGFVDDRIHVVSIENSFDLKEDIKAAGGRFRGEVGWYFSEPHEEFRTVEITADEALVENVWGSLEWRSTIKETVKSKLPPEPESEHIGKIGGKVSMDVTLTHTGYFTTHFGTTWVHTFKDEKGNVLVWKTGSCSGFESDKLHIQGTIKDHDEYREVKRTVLTRCKVS